MYQTQKLESHSRVQGVFGFCLPFIVGDKNCLLLQHVNIPGRPAPEYAGAEITVIQQAVNCLHLRSIGAGHVNRHPRSESKLAVIPIPIPLTAGKGQIGKERGELVNCDRDVVRARWKHLLLSVIVALAQKWCDVFGGEDNKPLGQVTEQVSEIDGYGTLNLQMAAPW